MGLMILRRRGLQESSEQGHPSNDVLAFPSEVWEGSIVFDDPSVHVGGHGAHAHCLHGA